MASNYKIAAYQARIEAKADAPEVKSLRDEVAILRMTLEEVMNQSDFNLALSVGLISDLVVKIAAVVEKCHKIERSMGRLLDKAQLIQFTSEVVQIVSETFAGQEEKLAIVSNKLLAALQDENLISED